jgi:peptide/nickel transport system substrate-binding protein
MVMHGPVGWAKPVIFCLLCLFILCACSQAPRESLRFGLSAMPVTLDPRYATDATSARIIRLLYQQLTDFDEHAVPRPALATWQVIDPIHYRFELHRPRPYFSDGTPLRASDVKATYDSIRDDLTASPLRGGFVNITAIEAVDDDHVDFYLRHPDPLFPGRLTVGILPARLIVSGHPFSRQPVGSGPFEWVRWSEESTLTLRRRQDGQVIEFVAVSDPTVRVLKLLRGEIDMVQNDLPPELIAYLRGRPEVKVKEGRGSNFAYLGFNMRDAVTGQLVVRRAIAHALDREDIIRYVLGQTARRAAGIFPPEHWAGLRYAAGIDYDPGLSRRLLVQAGFGPDHRPVIVYKTSNDPVRLRLATIIQHQLADVGIDVRLRTYDWGTFYADIRSGNFQMYSLMWVGAKLPEIFRYAFHSHSVPPAGANRGFFASAVADTLIEAAEDAPTIEAQAGPLERLQEDLLDELPYVPLWFEDHVFVARSGVTGYEIAPDGNYDSLQNITRIEWPMVSGQ